MKITFPAPPRPLPDEDSLDADIPFSKMGKSCHQTNEEYRTLILRIADLSIATTKLVCVLALWVIILTCVLGYHILWK